MGAFSCPQLILDCDSDIAYTGLMDNKPVLKAEQFEKKEYAYNMGGIELRFTLRTDIKQQMKLFIEMMERAREDIMKDLAKLDEK